jgi:hypothetical protein
MTTEQKLELVYNKCSTPELKKALLDRFQKEIDLLVEKENIKKKIESMSVEQKEILNLKLKCEEAKASMSTHVVGWLALFLIFIFIYGLVQLVMAFIR